MKTPKAKSNKPAELCLTRYEEYWKYLDRLNTTRGKKVANNSTEKGKQNFRNSNHNLIK